MKDNYAKTYRICMTRGHEGGNHFALFNHILLFYKRILKFNSWIHALKETSVTFTFYLHFIYERNTLPPSQEETRAYLFSENYN